MTDSSIDAGPHKRLAFSSHAAVSRFPIFSVPVLGGPAFPMAQFKERKREPRRRRFFACFRPIGVWCWVGGIDRAVGWAAYVFIRSRAHSFMGGLIHSIPNAVIRALVIHC